MIEMYGRLRHSRSESIPLPDSTKLQPVTPTQLAQQQRGGALILDTRPAEQFAARHIRGSIQISLLGNFASWAAIILDPEQKLLLIAEDLDGAREAQNRLARVGLRAVIGYSLADENEWRKAGLDLAPPSRSSDATRFDRLCNPIPPCSLLTSAAVPSG